MFVLVAVLFNPFVPIEMKKDDWLFFDLITVVIFVPHAIFGRLDGSGYVKRAFWQIYRVLLCQYVKGGGSLSNLRDKSKRREYEINEEATQE